MADSVPSNKPPTDTPSPDAGPDPYADHAEIKALVERKKSEWAKGRENIVRSAWRNLLFNRGIQWVKWDRGTSRWRPARLPKNTPTPVTNRYASTISAVISVFA